MLETLGDGSIPGISVKMAFFRLMFDEIGIEIEGFEYFCLIWRLGVSPSLVSRWREGYSFLSS